MLERLIELAERELRLPEIIGERCVHALMEQSSCEACVAVCPRGAWILDDERLGIDPDACDGCGLCAAVCPEAAIIHEHEPVQRDWQSATLSFCACDRTGLAREDGLIPCLHALSMRDLLRLYRQGSRRLLVSHSDCRSCSRGEAPSLETSIADLNRFLEQRQLPPLELTRLPPVAWQNMLTCIGKPAAGPQRSRRAFLRRTVARTMDEGMKLAGLARAEREAFTPIGKLLPSASADDPLPFVPEIDVAACNGCDACVKLCPHAAICLERDEHGSGYRIDAALCTGCGICTDGCDQKAISVARWRPQRQVEIKLAESRCQACGAPFHEPCRPSQANEVCRICAKANHYRNLYQVLD